MIDRDWSCRLGDGFEGRLAACHCGEFKDLVHYHRSAAVVVLYSGFDVPLPDCRTSFLHASGSVGNWICTGMSDERGDRHRN